MKALEVANYFLSLVDEDSGDVMTNMKLQKLLYYAQGFSLVLLGEPVFEEKIKHWVHGPVVPQVWHEFKEYDSKPIPKPERFDYSIYPQAVQELLTEVYNVYGSFSAAALRKMTHDEPPWRDTPPNEEITHSSLKEFFQTLIIES